MATVELTMLACGHCTHLELMVIAGGALAQVEFPSLVGVIRHPRHGVILFDTGYSRRFFDETASFPAIIYRQTTPVVFQEADGLAVQLRARGIDPAEVGLVLLSHFHADHVGGARDFPNARFVCYEDAWRKIRHLTGFAALKQAFLPGLLPADFESRVTAVEGLAQLELPARLRPFTVGADLLGDGSVVVVPLPGHAVGHFGVVLDTDPAPTFLVADACWLSRAFREDLLPHPLANVIFDDPAAYRASLRRIHELHVADPQVMILPSHCREVWASRVAGADPAELAR